MLIINRGALQFTHCIPNTAKHVRETILIHSLGFKSLQGKIDSEVLGLSTGLNSKMYKLTRKGQRPVLARNNEWAGFNPNNLNQGAIYMNVRFKELLFLFHCLFCGRDTLQISILSARDY